MKDSPDLVVQNLMQKFKHEHQSFVRCMRNFSRIKKIKKGYEDEVDKMKKEYSTMSAAKRAAYKKVFFYMLRDYTD